MPLVLGGDCLLTALGTVAGVQHTGQTPGIVWFDAHGDFNTPETSPSGLLVGMPLAMLAGRGELTLIKEIGVKRVIPEWHILLAGTRDLDQAEAAALEDSDVTMWSAQDLGIAGADELGRGMAGWPPIYLHLDLDVVDPTLMPAVSYPSSGGLTLETLSAGIQAVAASGRICALGIASYCPERDQNHRGLAASMEVIESALRASVD
jgi:arginase